LESDIGTRKINRRVKEWVAELRRKKMWKELKKFAGRRTCSGWSNTSVANAKDAYENDPSPDGANDNPRNRRAGVIADQRCVIRDL